ncbi:hypothetical protein EVAR_23669_1 [Eumeta japonica]|uniref:Uncharacterized protein n=1 Tax=Eumeta variegata TaxID=151549 RepID=A0A4C1VIH9_EUMVA|nr:hypothetical protein EVAR_23669_1 [Eumeta japonica]
MSNHFRFLELLRLHNGLRSPKGNRTPHNIHARCRTHERRRSAAEPVFIRQPNELFLRTVDKILLVKKSGINCTLKSPHFWHRQLFEGIISYFQYVPLIRRCRNGNELERINGHALTRSGPVTPALGAPPSQSRRRLSKACPD